MPQPQDNRPSFWEIDSTRGEYWRVAPFPVVLLVSTAVYAWRVTARRRRRT